MSSPQVQHVDAGTHKVARSVEVQAEPSEIFALVANPHRHHELDGSGTVRDAEVKGPQELSQGDTFTVKMKQYGLPYAIKSTAVEVERDHVVAWQHPMGHIWRWEIRQSRPGISQVTETFDYSTAKAPKVLELTGFPKKNGQGITRTLEKLAERFA